MSKGGPRGLKTRYFSITRESTLITEYMEPFGLDFSHEPVCVRDVGQDMGVLTRRVQEQQTPATSQFYYTYVQ